MRYSVLWAPLFFVGLLLACTRFLEGMQTPAAPGAHPNEKAVVMHRVKIALETHDTLEARERPFAETANVAPAWTR
jgi:hypothetical protein